jgi:hypothetical protein
MKVLRNSKNSTSVANNSIFDNINLKDFLKENNSVERKEIYEISTKYSQKSNYLENTNLKVLRDANDLQSNLKVLSYSKNSVNLPSIELFEISFQENNDYTDIQKVFKIENDKKNNLFHVCGIKSI